VVQAQFVALPDPNLVVTHNCSMSCMQGMSLVPSVTELIMAELLYLQYDNAVKPINMYINSTGVTVRSASRWRHMVASPAATELYLALNGHYNSIKFIRI
jgi:ATP-dependent protease ClpP protease subunit